jgi:hypothetical protein
VVDVVEDFSSAFQRNPDGSWSTIRPIVLTHNERIIGLGRGVTLDPGDVLVGLDVVDWLEGRSGGLRD